MFIIAVLLVRYTDTSVLTCGYPPQHHCARDAWAEPARRKSAQTPRRASRISSGNVLYPRHNVATRPVESSSSEVYLLLLCTSPSGACIIMLKKREREREKKKNNEIKNERKKASQPALCQRLVFSPVRDGGAAHPADRERFLFRPERPIPWPMQYPCRAVPFRQYRRTRCALLLGKCSKRARCTKRPSAGGKAIRGFCSSCSLLHYAV